MRLNNTLANNKDVTEEIKEEIKNYPDTNDNESMTTQSLWDSGKTVLTSLPQETRETSNKQPNFTHKQLENNNNNNNKTQS